MPARLGFAGTPEFAATILKTLIDHQLQPVVVYTQPDRPTGRGRKLKPSPVKEVALSAGIPVRQPTSLKHESLEADELDVLVVAAYGLILPQHILDAPKHGCINVHASLLPRWRGAAPVERAIMAGDATTGVCIMQMDRGLDTGPVYKCRELAISATVTGIELEGQLAVAGAELLIECLRELDTLSPRAQQGEATYANKLSRADSEIDWQRPAAAIAAQVRALSGRMPATCISRGASVKLLRASATAGGGGEPGCILKADKQGICVQCGDGILKIEELKLDRGKGQPLSAAAALNGYADLFTAGTRLDERPGD